MTENPERRYSRWNRPEQLVYVDLESGNGGMMLNVSEEGFSFRVMNPVLPSGTIRFAFEIDGNRRLEGTGELEWAQEDGKVGGLRFTDVSEEFRGEIRRWLAKSQPSVAAETPVIPAAAPLDTREKLRSQLRTEPAKAKPVELPDEEPKPKIEAPSPAAASGDAAEKSRWTEDVQPRKPRMPASPMERPQTPKITLPVASKVPEVEIQESRLARPAMPNVENLETQKQTKPPTGLPGLHLRWSKAVVAPGQEEKEAARESAVGRTFATAAELREELTGQSNAAEREKSKKPATTEGMQKGFLSRLSRGAAVGIVAAALLVVLSEAVFIFRTDVGRSLIWLGEKLAGDTTPADPHLLPSTPTVNQPANLSRSSRAAGAGSSPALAKAPPVLKTPVTPANSSEVASPETAPEEPGQAELAVAQRILGSKNGSRDITGAMKLLWVAVQKGNSTAVLTLSDLYARGEVVAKNCAQARVLLTAAAKKGSADAQARLEQLSQEGCE